MIVNQERVGRDPSDQLDDLRVLLATFRAADSDALPAWVRANILLNLSSVFINVAGDAHDVDALLHGAGLARESASSGQLTPAELRRSYYNEAVALSAAADVQTRAAVDRKARVPGDWALARWSVREWLVTARRLFRKAADSAEDGDAEQASTALCNLANGLDGSSRWVEAYDWYVQALNRDPTNGNAAGNAAVLIGRAANVGWGNRVHLLGLHDRYLLRARELRDRTVQIAGESAAQLYDDMELSRSDHAGDEIERLDPYQAWVLGHRLALTPALEGIGHSSDQWDDAFLSRARTPIDSNTPPAIFPMLNLIKADYLVARRLLYRAEVMLAEQPVFQHPDDPGAYMDTRDGAAYGEPMAMIVLAQRAALDVLDKLAVAINEHFAIGDATRTIYFSNYWTETVTDSNGKDLVLRPSLLAAMPGAERCILAMAELALDMGKAGIYERAKTMRHAGTHRFALLTRTELPSRPSVHTFRVGEALAAAGEALAVARAAYLYLVAGLEIVESNRPAPMLNVEVTQQRKASHYQGDRDAGSETLTDPR